MQKRTWTILILISLLAVVAARWWWQRPPAVAYNNLRYIQLLRTAVSSRRPDHLDGVRRAVQHQLESQQMSESEYQHFQQIISNAVQGDWEQADRRAFEFEAAQLSRWR